MAALTSAQKQIRNALIEEVARQRPGDFPAAIREGMRQFRTMLKEGLSGAMAPSTGTNNLNNNDTSRNSEDDVAGNSFEAFLQRMIEAVCSQAIADGKANPAYTQLAAKLAASQALGMSGPAAAASVAMRGAGSLPVGRTESAPRAKVTETLTFAGTALSGQGGPAQPGVAATPAAKPFDQMTQAELGRELMAGFDRAHRAGTLRSSVYATAAA